MCTARATLSKCITRINGQIWILSPLQGKGAQTAAWSTIRVSQKEEISQVLFHICKRVRWGWIGCEESLYRSPQAPSFLATEQSVFLVFLGGVWSFKISKPQLLGFFYASSSLSHWQLSRVTGVFQKHKVWTSSPRTSLYEKMVQNDTLCWLLGQQFVQKVLCLI